jgi:HEAT repeat protein
MCLVGLNVDTDLVIRELADNLENSKGNKNDLLFSLRYCGVKARPAVPALLKFLNDPDLKVRENTTNALLKIDPEALKRATGGLSP